MHELDKVIHKFRPDRNLERILIYNALSTKYTVKIRFGKQNLRAGWISQSRLPDVKLY